MKTTNKVLTALVITAALISTSCKKNQTGGEAMIHARIQHHGEPVTGSNVLYVKFNADKQPSDPTNNYDMRVEGEAGENHVHVEGLRAGKYYLYAVSTEVSGPEVLHGGAAVTVKWNERKLMKDVVIEATHE